MPRRLAFSSILPAAGVGARLLGRGPARAGAADAAGAGSAGERSPAAASTAAAIADDLVEGELPEVGRLPLADRRSSEAEELAQETRALALVAFRDGELARDEVAQRDECRTGRLHIVVRRLRGDDLPAEIFAGGIVGAVGPRAAARARDGDRAARGPPDADRHRPEGDRVDLQRDHDATAGAALTLRAVLLDLLAGDRDDLAAEGLCGSVELQHEHGDDHRRRDERLHLKTSLLLQRPSNRAVPEDSAHETCSRRGSARRLPSARN